MVVPHANSSSSGNDNNGKSPNEVENIAEGGRKASSGDGVVEEKRGCSRLVHSTPPPPRQSQYWNSGHHNSRVEKEEEEGDATTRLSPAMVGGEEENRVFASSSSAPFSTSTTTTTTTSSCQQANKHFFQSPAVTTSSILPHQDQQAGGGAGTAVKQRTVGVVEPRVVVRIPREEKGKANKKVNSNKEGDEQNSKRQLQQRDDDDDDEKFENGKMGMSDSGYCITKKLPPHFREALRKRRRNESGGSSSEMTMAFSEKRRKKKKKFSRNKVSSSSSSSFLSSEEEEEESDAKSHKGPSSSSYYVCSNKKVERPWRLDLDDVMDGGGGGGGVGGLGNPTRGKQGVGPNVNLRKLGHVGGSSRNVSVGGNRRRKRRREQRKLHMTRPQSGCIREQEEQQEEEEEEEGKYGDGRLSAVADGRDQVTRGSRDGGGWRKSREKGRGAAMSAEGADEERCIIPITMKNKTDIGMIMTGQDRSPEIREAQQGVKNGAEERFPYYDDNISGARLANKSIRTVTSNGLSSVNDVISPKGNNNDTERRRGNNKIRNGNNNKAALATIKDFDNDAAGKNLSKVKTKDALAISNETVSGDNDNGATEICHEYKDEWLFCRLCPPDSSRFYTRKPERMARHRLFHSLGGNEGGGSNHKYVYKCPDCKKRFASLAKALKHDRLSHTEVPDYECRVCGQEVTDIKSHMKVFINIITV